MTLFLNLIYSLALLAFLPVLLWQRWVGGKRRPGLWVKLSGRIPRRTSTRPCILVHAVSLGEVNLIRPLVQRLEGCRNPQVELVISTSTQTGLEAARRNYPSHNVVLFPFDFSWSVKNFLNRLRPDVLVLTELEIWPNLIRESKRRGIRCSVANGRLSESSFRKYRRLAFLMRPVFRCLDLVCVQNEDTRARFNALGVRPENLVVTGNLKFDSVPRNLDPTRIARFRSLASCRNGELIFLAGSTQAPEEQLAIDVYQRLYDRFPDLRFFLCPRHPERFDEVAGLLEASGIPFTRRSDQDFGVSKCENVLLLDSMGELSDWWTLADIAFVGGSFGNRGGQNMLEPAARGAAVCVGPNTRNFVHEVEMLTKAGAIKQLQDAEELLDFVERCITSEDFRSSLQESAAKFFSDYLAKRDNAADLTIQALGQLITLSESAAPEYRVA